MTSVVSVAPATRHGVLSTALDRARVGLATVVIGSGGSGKSRLLQELRATLDRTDAPARLLTATASGSSIPFGTLLPLLDAPTTRRIAMADALGRAMLLRVAVLELGLGALLIDEAAFTDPASAAFVLELAQSGTAVVLAVTSGTEPPDALRVLQRSDFALAVPLPPLDRVGIAEVAESVLGAPPDEGAARELMSVSGGNPGLAQALARQGAAAGALQRSGALWVLTGVLRVPTGMQRVIERRMGALPEAARAWLTAVAIADQVPMDLAPRLASPEVLDRTDREGWTLADPAIDGYRIRQRAVQVAIASALGVQARAAALRGLIAAYAAAPRELTDVELTALAGWRLESGQPVDPELALRLGLLTTLSAPTLSERLLREAARRGDVEAELALAEHLKRTSRMDEAEALLGVAQPQDPSAADRVAATLALVTGFAARHSASTLAVLDAKIAAGQVGPDAEAVRLGLLLRERRLAETREAVGRLARPRRADFASVLIGLHEVMLEVEQSDADAALAAIAELREPAERTTDRIPEGPIALEWLTGYAAAVVELDIATAAPIAEREYARMLETGMHSNRTQFAHLLALCRMLQGDPAAAARLLHEAEAIPGIWRDSWLPRILGPLTAALALSGDLRAANRAHARLTAIARSPEHEGSLTLANARLDAAGGDHAAAIATARAGALRAVDQQAWTEAFDLFALAAGFGDAESAASLLALNPAPHSAIRDLQREQARALLASDAPGVAAVADRLWAAEHRLLAIEAMTLAAGLDPASDAAERAAMWQLHTTTLLLPASPNGAHASLTRRERQVARLASAGRTDREIAEQLGMSVRTAQTHVARAFAKLGVHRRSELGSVLGAEAGDTDD